MRSDPRTPRLSCHGTQSFSEIALAFRITLAIVLTAMVFATIMGVIGDLLPAVRGARLPITSALREA